MDVLGTVSFGPAWRRPRSAPDPSGWGILLAWCPRRLPHMPMSALFLLLACVPARVDGCIVGEGTCGAACACDCVRVCGGGVKIPRSQSADLPQRLHS